jgi:hypothetical protein
MRALRWTIAASCALAVALPAPASAVTFGADLSVAPNVDFDCTLTPPVGGFQVSSGAETCTWWTTGRISDTSEGHIVPYGGGTIVRARVRVGPVSGPMQFVVMRSLRHPQSLADPACCFPVGASEVFVPAPNAITTVPMNVPVRNDTDPASGINNYDHIAISVLAPGVPIPAFYTGDQSLSAPTGGGFYPAYTPGTERTTGMFGVVGFQTLINADLDPTAPGAGTPTGPTDTSGLIAPVKVGPAAQVRNGRAMVPLTCDSPQSCAGLLRLLGPAFGGGAGASKKGPRGVAYGKARFQIPAGQRRKVPVRLTGVAKKVLRKRGSVGVQAEVKIGKERTKARVSLRG